MTVRDLVSVMVELGFGYRVVFQETGDVEIRTWLELMNEYGDYKVVYFAPKEMEIAII